MPPIPVILDVDTGIDDALAILLALASPELEIVGVTCVAGNVRLEQVVENTRGVLALGRAEHVPVAIGAAKPLVRRLTTATFFHGEDGVGGVSLPAPTGALSSEVADAFLVRMANEYDGKLSIVAVGPATNVALACRRDPTFPDRVARLVLMSGAATVPGNVTPAAEANAYNDPEALAHVINCFGARGTETSQWGGARLTMVGLDVTLQTLFPAPEHVSLASIVATLGPVARTAHALLGPYIAADLAAGLSGSPLHDPLAVDVMAHPEVVVTRPATLAIETVGVHTRGATVANLSGRIERLEPVGDADDCAGLLPITPNCHVAIGVRVEEFVDRFRLRLGLVAS
jgi:purine nucleosidase